MSKLERFSPYISPKVSDLAVSKFSFERSKASSPQTRNSPIPSTQRDLEFEHEKALEKIDALQAEKQQLKNTMKVLLDRRADGSEESVMNSKYVKEAYASRALIKELEDKYLASEQEKMQLKADLEAERKKYFSVLKEQQLCQNRLVDFERISSSNATLKIEMMKLNAELNDINQKVVELEAEKQSLIRMVEPEGTLTADSADYLQYVFNLLNDLPSSHYAKVSFQERFSSEVEALSELQKKQYPALFLKTIGFATDLLVNLITERNSISTVRDNLDTSFESSRLQNTKISTRMNTQPEQKRSHMDSRQNEMIAINDDHDMRNDYKSNLRNESIDSTTSYIHVSLLPTGREASMQGQHRGELGRERQLDQMKRSVVKSPEGNSQMRMESHSSAFKPKDMSSAKRHQSQSMYDDATTATPNMNDSISMSRHKTPMQRRPPETEITRTPNANIKIQNFEAEERDTSRSHSRSFQRQDTNRANYQMNDLSQSRDYGEADYQTDRNRISRSQMLAKEVAVQEDTYQDGSFQDGSFHDGPYQDDQYYISETLEGQRNAPTNEYSPQQNYKDQSVNRPNNQPSNRKSQFSRHFENPDTYSQNGENFNESERPNPNVNYSGVPLSNRASQQQSVIPNRQPQGQTPQQMQKAQNSSRIYPNNQAQPSNAMNQTPEHPYYQSSEPIMKRSDSTRSTPQQSTHHQNFEMSDQKKSTAQFQYQTHRPQSLNIPTEESDVDPAQQQQQQAQLNMSRPPTMTSQGGVNYSKSIAYDNPANPHHEQFFDSNQRQPNQTHTNPVYTKQASTNSENAALASFRGEHRNQGYPIQEQQQQQQQQQHNYYPERQLGNSNTKQQVFFEGRPSQSNQPEINLQDNYHQQIMPNNGYLYDGEQFEFSYPKELDQGNYVQTKPQNVRYSENIVQRQPSSDSSHASNRNPSHSQQNTMIEYSDQPIYSSARSSRDTKGFEQNGPRSARISEQDSINKGQQGQSEYLENPNQRTQGRSSKATHQQPPQQTQQFPQQQHHQSLHQSQSQSQLQGAKSQQQAYPQQQQQVYPQQQQQVYPQQQQVHTQQQAYPQQQTYPQQQQQQVHSPQQQAYPQQQQVHPQQQQVYSQQPVHTQQQQGYPQQQQPQQGYSQQPSYSQQPQQMQQGFNSADTGGSMQQQNRAPTQENRISQQQQAYPQQQQQVYPQQQQVYPQQQQVYPQQPVHTQQPQQGYPQQQQPQQGYPQQQQPQQGYSQQPSYSQQPQQMQQGFNPNDSRGSIQQQNRAPNQENRTNTIENRANKQGIPQNQQNNSQMNSSSQNLNNSMIDSATKKLQGSIPRHDPILEAARYENKQKRMSSEQNSARRSGSEFQERPQFIHEEDLRGFENTTTQDFQPDIQVERLDTPDSLQSPQYYGKAHVVQDPHLTIQANRSVSFEEEEKSPTEKKIVANTSILKPSQSQSDFLNATDNSFRTMRVSPTLSKSKSFFAKNNTSSLSRSQSPSEREKSFRVSFGKTMSHDMSKKADRFEIVPVGMICIDESAKKGRVAYPERQFNIISGLPRDIVRMNSKEINSATEPLSADARSETPC